MYISEDMLVHAPWESLVRLGRALGVELPEKCRDRRMHRRAVRLVMGAIDPPVDWAAEARKSAAGQKLP